MYVTIITATGSRPEAFGLCEQYVSRQTRKPDRWIVVDDGSPETELSSGQEVIRPLPMEGPSLDRNLLAAFDLLTPADEAIVFLEDDDWYDFRYLEKYVPLLETYPIVGEADAIYYNVQTRRVLNNRNRQHASLCSTLIRYEAIDALRQICQEGNLNAGHSFADIKLWRFSKFGGRGFLNFDPVKPPLSVGIKGMPGRFGIGKGHDPLWLEGRGAIFDPDLRILAGLIGPIDAEKYREFGEPAR